MSCRTQRRLALDGRSSNRGARPYHPKRARTPGQNRRIKTLIRMVRPIDRRIDPTRQPGMKRTSVRLPGRLVKRNTSL